MVPVEKVNFLNFLFKVYFLNFTAEFPLDVLFKINILRYMYNTLCGAVNSPFQVFQSFQDFEMNTLKRGNEHLYSII